LKVLLAHNFYRSSAPSGEDNVFRNERALLGSRLEVVEFIRRNDDIDESTLGRKVKLALDGAWSRGTYAALSELIRSSRPDIAHFHNTFPQISASAYAACRDHGVPVVQTLHNYRFICPGALLMRDGRPCEDCVRGGLGLLPALVHRCYRGSLAATGAQVYAIASNRRRGSFSRLVNRYIALTHFAGGKLAQGGLPKERIEVKPNFLPAPPPPGPGNGGYAIYVGRLTPEKGVATLLRAWRGLKDLPLKIVGDGAERGEYERFAAAEGLPVEFLGFRNSEEILSLVGGASFQVMPSEWYEGFPMVILEAYACGTPVLASRIGSLAEIVADGVTGSTFTPGDAADLASRARALADSAALAEMRRNARQEFEGKYTAERSFNRLMEIYEHAIADFEAGGR
jgi:glycosyltransferase involved in cell wall biosynthesis